MGTGAASVIDILVGSAVVVCAISRIFCYYMSSYDGSGLGRGALLILAGLGLINLHVQQWPWPDSIDSHVASAVHSLIICGVGVLFTMKAATRLFIFHTWHMWVWLGLYGVGALLLGAGNALIQLSFIWHQSNLSDWGIGVAILGFLIVTVSMIADFNGDDIMFRWRMWRHNMHRARFEFRMSLYEIGPSLWKSAITWAKWKAVEKAQHTWWWVTWHWKDYRDKFK